MHHSFAHPRQHSGKQHCTAWLMASMACVALLLGACSPATIKGQRIASGSKVLVIGDSISAGYGVGAEQSWVAHLQAQSGWQVINAGVSGDTTSDGLARLPQLITTHQPSAVIIELGGNDMLRRVEEPTIIKNLEDMIKLAKANNAQALLMAIPKTSLVSLAFSSGNDAEFYAQIAKQHHTPLIPNAVTKVLSNDTLRLDKIHPNVEGHRQLADAVLKGLRDINVLQ